MHMKQDMSHLLLTTMEFKEMMRHIEGIQYTAP